jgi:hypothetical protein
MNNIIVEIENILQNQYPAGFGALFVAGIKKHIISIEDFKKEIQLSLPNIFYEFYEWANQVQFTKTDISDKVQLDYDDENYLPSLKSILQETQEWQAIQAQQPDREWKGGFVAIGGWNSAYVQVIDTLGEIGKAGCVLYWDYKGGSTYHIIHQDYEAFLKTKLALLKANLYFTPHWKLEEEFEDFMEGEKREQIEAIKQKINQKSRQFIDFD